jgi:hypothetical protein
MWWRLLGLLIMVGAPVLLFPLMVKYPGRSANTGLPDSGCFGWISSILMVFGLVLLIGGRKVFYDPPKDEEKKDER